MPQDDVDNATDAFIAEMTRIGTDKSLSEEERGKLISEKHHAWLAFLDENGVERPVQQRPENASRRKLQQVFDVIKAENLEKMRGKNEEGNPLALTNISDQQMAQIMPLAQEFWRDTLGLDIGEQLLDFVDTDGSLRSIRFDAYMNECNLIKIEPFLTPEAREEKLKDAKQRFMDYVHADNERLDRNEEPAKREPVDIGRLALSDPSALDALSDHELEHLRILTKRELEDRQEDRQHIEKRVSDLKDKEDDESVFGYLFNAVKQPFNKAALREKHKLLEIIELNQKRRRTPGHQGAALDEKINQAIRARNAREAELQGIGATEDEIRRELNFRNDKIRELQEQRRNHL